MSSPNFKTLTNLSPILSIIPTAVRRTSLDILEQALDGELSVVDPSNPFLFLLEASAANTANAIIKSQSEVLKQYRGLATNEEELLIHMADADHKDRFSKPASHHVTFIVNKAQLINNAVVDGNTNFKRAIIPKDTVWRVGVYEFYHHYPINVDISPGEDVVAYFDTTVVTPIGSVNTNVVETKEILFDNQPSVIFKIPVDQLGFNSVSEPITKSSGLKLSIPFDDKFYFARVYHTKDNKNWSEFITTYTREAYDVNKPTVILSVVDGVLKVTLPQIYVTKGLVGSNARVDIYTTKGLVSLSLDDFVGNQWDVDWNDPSGQASGYSDAFLNLLTYSLSSYGKMEGGHNGLTFDELRESVFYGLDGKLNAVTDLELENQLGKRGYSVTVQKDSIAERVYVATNRLPSIATKKLTSLPGTICEDIFFDTGRIDLGSQTVDNGDTITIKSGSLFSESSSGISLASISEKEDLESLDKFNLIDKLNNERHFYNPFHYVLDSSNGLFATRAYYLDAPAVNTLFYSRSNQSLGYTFIPSSSDVSLDDNVYTLNFTVDTTKGIEDSYGFLYYKDSTGKRFYVKASQVVVTPEISTFTFEIITTLAISKDDKITVTNFKDENNVEETIEINLDANFELIFTSETVINTSSDFDDLITSGSHSEMFSAVSLCILNVSLGRPLEPLYTRSRPIRSPEEYERYEDDVYYTYPADVPKRNAKGIVYTRDETGALVIEKEHLAGDYMLDDDGERSVQFIKGTVKLDNSGFPTIVKEKRISREIRVFLVDIKYLFADEETVVDYRKNIPEVVYNNIGEIIAYRPQLQGLTSLFYEPRSTDVSALVRINALKQGIVSTALTFNIEVTVRSEDYDDANLRALTTDSIRKILHLQLESNFFSFSDTITKLNEIGGNSILNINFTSSFPGDTVTLVDLNAAFTIKSRIVPVSTGKLGIEDAINFTWLKG